MNLDTGIWNLPPERTKNSQAHTIYLGSLGVDLIRALRPLTGGSEFVFSAHLASGHLHPDSMGTALSRLRKPNPALHKTESHTVHDFRRSAATAWGEHLKVLPHVIERMLNHQPVNKLVATYQRAMYTDEQRAAWRAWDEMVEHQVIRGDGNVVLLRQTG